MKRIALSVCIAAASAFTVSNAVAQQQGMSGTEGQKGMSGMSGQKGMSGMSGMEGGKK